MQSVRRRYHAADGPKQVPVCRKYHINTRPKAPNEVATSCLVQSFGGSVEWRARVTFFKLLPVLLPSCLPRRSSPIDWSQMLFFVWGRRKKGAMTPATPAQSQQVPGRGTTQSRVWFPVRLPGTLAGWYQDLGLGPAHAAGGVRPCMDG